MSENIITVVEPDAVIDAAEFNTAEALARTAGGSVYIHTFGTPFVWGGQTCETLTFDWGSLTGMDSLAIESEMAALNKFMIAAEFSGEYLTRMAARACTLRNEQGGRILSTDALKAMPLQDFNKICSRARSFLLQSGL